MNNERTQIDLPRIFFLQTLQGRIHTVHLTVKSGGGRVITWSCMSAKGAGEMMHLDGTINVTSSAGAWQKRPIPALRAFKEARKPLCGQVSY